MLEAVLDFLETKAIKRHLARSPTFKKKGVVVMFAGKHQAEVTRELKLFARWGKLWQICSRRGGKNQVKLKKMSLVFWRKLCCQEVTQKRRLFFQEKVRC